MNPGNIFSHGAAPPPNGSHMSSSTFTSILNSNDDTDKIRASPSFISDSEPPSYFEAVGIAQQINFSTYGGASDINSHGAHKQQRMNNSKKGEVSYSSHKETPIQTTGPSTQHYPNHQRHHIIRTRNLEPNNVSNYHGSYNSNSDSIESVLKPSETFMVWSIFTTIYCVFIGIVALIFSIKVHHYNKQGDYEKAYSRSRLAKYFNIAGLFVGIVYMAIGALICFLPIG